MQLNKVINMNKSEIREVAKIAQYHAAGLGADFVARALSSLIRAARTKKSAAALREYAEIFGVAGHAEFIC
jgi:hypothetical protein